MKINSTLLLSVALIAAGVVALIVRSQLPGTPVAQQAPVPAPTPVEKTAVLVTARDLSPGDFIDGSAVRWQETDQPVSRTFYFIRGKDQESQLYGATLRGKIPAGTPLNNNSVVRPNEPGFIAAVLRPGMRAISIPTSVVASNAGLVSAGDYVDIILSLRRDDEVSLQPTSQQPVPPPVVGAQTVARNLRVLALNNQTDAITSMRPRQDTNGAEPAQNTPQGRQRTPIYQSITLEATPKQAEVLTVAKEVGLLQMAQRSALETSDDAGAQTTVTTLKDTTGIYSKMVSSGHQVKMFRGDRAEVKQFPAR
ncbi:Flp pilus assembly protein CpaB [Dickeya chrysanthemi]|uniref:Flp pilus assembly protein CpaB n=1 Tax=Dickeya chrysanthemi TaxID=556 RepID=UPI0025A058BB|nr:Flp pilus assembly protein CpaB [Dickeya chrysanthemi]WJM83658.1 Flp pilus assembly protein CpaB [Dickeya chrysanthemi]